MSSNNAFFIPIFENFFPKLVFLLVQKKNSHSLFQGIQLPQSLSIKYFQTTQELINFRH